MISVVVFWVWSGGDSISALNNVEVKEFDDIGVLGGKFK